MKQQQQKIKSSQDRFTITLPLELARQVRQVAKRENISISFFARQAIETKLEQMGQEQTDVQEEQLTLQERRRFMELPLEERKRRMEEQAENIKAHYEQEAEWKELQGGDIVEY